MNDLADHRRRTAEHAAEKSRDLTHCSGNASWQVAKQIAQAIDDREARLRNRPQDVHHHAGCRFQRVADPTGDTSRRGDNDAEASRDRLQHPVRLILPRPERGGGSGHAEYDESNWRGDCGDRPADQSRNRGQSAKGNTRQARGETETDEQSASDNERTGCRGDQHHQVLVLFDKGFDCVKGSDRIAGHGLECRSHRFADGDRHVFGCGHGDAKRTTEARVHFRGRLGSYALGFLQLLSQAGNVRGRFADHARGGDAQQSEGRVELGRAGRGTQSIGRSIHVA